MKYDEFVGLGGSAIGTISTMVQTNEKLRIIQAVLTIITLLISTAYTLWKWYKKASKDGKITKEEVDELFDEVNKVVSKKEDSEDDKI